MIRPVRVLFSLVNLLTGDAFCSEIVGFGTFSATGKAFCKGFEPEAVLGTFSAVGSWNGILYKFRVWYQFLPFSKLWFTEFRSKRVRDSFETDALRIVRFPNPGAEETETILPFFATTAYGCGSKLGASLLFLCSYIATLGGLLCFEFFLIFRFVILPDAFINGNLPLCRSLREFAPCFTIEQE